MIHSRFSPLPIFTAVVSLLIVPIGSVSDLVAQDATSTSIANMIVCGEAEADSIVQDPFLPAVEGTRIKCGKKTSVITSTSSTDR